jgi:hypothetical protein
MGDQFNMPTAPALIDVATQNGTAAGQDLAHIFKNHRPDPSLVLGYELNPTEIAGVKFTAGSKGDI